MPRKKIKVNGKKTSGFWKLEKPRTAVKLPTVSTPSLTLPSASSACSPFLLLPAGTKTNPLQSPRRWHRRNRGNRIRTRGNRSAPSRPSARRPTACSSPDRGVAAFPAPGLCHGQLPAGASPAARCGGVAQRPLPCGCAPPWTQRPREPSQDLAKPFPLFRRKRGILGNRDLRRRAVPLLARAPAAAGFGAGAAFFAFFSLSALSLASTAVASVGLIRL